MSSRVRIKMGQVEVEYEGDAQFLKDELPALLDSVSKLYREARSLNGDDDALDVPGPETPGAPKLHGVGTTNNIAAKIGAGSGSDLVLAAAARLTLGAGKPTFSRQALLEEMKTATSYFNKNYANNLSKYLTALVKAAKLMETAKDTYALSATALAEIEAKIAG